MKTLIVLSLNLLLLLNTLQTNAQSCTITCPENIIVKADSATGGTYVNFANATSNGNCGVLSYAPASGSFFKLGSSSVIVTSASGQRCSFTVTVTDNEPPTLSPIVLSSKRLWPANGRMRDVSVRYITSDNSIESACAISIVSNDPDTATRDWEIIDNHLIRLKALRLKNGMARVFTVTVTCTDAAGNTTKRSTGITVARNNP